MVRGSTPDTAIGWPPTTKRAAARCCGPPARADLAAGAAEFGLGDKGDPGLDLGWISALTLHSPPSGTAQWSAMKR